MEIGRTEAEFFQSPIRTFLWQYSPSREDCRAFWATQYPCVLESFEQGRAAPPAILLLYSHPVLLARIIWEVLLLHLTEEEAAVPVVTEQSLFRRIQDPAQIRKIEQKYSQFFRIAADFVERSAGIFVPGRNTRDALLEEALWELRSWNDPSPLDTAYFHENVVRPAEALFDQQPGPSAITLMHFTSETPEDKRALNRSPLANANCPRCRILTRDEGRNHPPDILITDYSMLEYMLSRPQDAPFFGPALRAQVLDEIHLYTGTLAADICLLLRRVLIRCGVDPNHVLHIATSATLGGSQEDLRAFGARIFSKDPDLVRCLRGKSFRRELPPAAPPESEPRIDLINAGPLESVALLDAEAKRLFEDPDVAESARACVAPLIHSTVIRELGSETAPARVLHSALSRAPLVHQLDDFFWKRAKDGSSLVPLHEVSKALFPDVTSAQADKAATALLQLCARARWEAESLPLIPHKLHLQVRAPGHFSVCLNPECTCEKSKMVPGAGMLIPDLVHACPECGSATLTLAVCDNCGEWMLAGSRAETTLRIRSRWDRQINTSAAQKAKSQHLFLRPAGEHSDGPEYSLNLDTRQLLDSSGSRVVFLARIEECPNCCADSSYFRAMNLPDALTVTKDATATPS